MSARRRQLAERLARGDRVQWYFFWGDAPRPDGQLSGACFSQWWHAPMVITGTTYPAAEHYMMAEKARLFGDEESLTRILTAAHPAEAKALGRAVRGFDEERWIAARFDIVVRGSVAKFSQHPELRAFLLETGERVLVEAAPGDRIWGIGLAEGDPRAREPARWPGLNLLGFALMETRARLRAG